LHIIGEQSISKSIDRLFVVNLKSHIDYLMLVFTLKGWEVALDDRCALARGQVCVARRKVVGDYERVQDSVVSSFGF